MRQSAELSIRIKQLLGHTPGSSRGLAKAASFFVFWELYLPVRTLRNSSEKDGKETEPWEILNSKAYKSQLPVIEQALETAALMLGSDKSRGYCLEMICADFLAGVILEAGNRDTLLPCHIRLVIFLPKRNGSNTLKRCS